jgi:carboxypeptidase PM20D1
MSNETNPAIARLSKAVSIETVSHPDFSLTDWSRFDAFDAFLRDNYPKFHQTAVLTKINNYALAYRWAGSDGSLPPLCMMAHYDVVPANAAEWKHPPFSGQVAEGRVWGRGTLDIKSQLTAEIEAAERLIASGWTPKRDVWFCWGYDEEVGGEQGAAKLVSFFKEKGIRFEGVIDEGGIVSKGEMIKGLSASLALIGTAEKGVCNYTLHFPGTGGHASMPPVHTALGNAAAFITQMEDNPMPASLTPPVIGLLKNLGPLMGGAIKTAVKHLGLMKGIIIKFLSKGPVTNAMVRTTLAATQAAASSAPNVLPDGAVVTVNSRILPGDTIASVQAHLQSLAPDAKITTQGAAEPSPISPEDSHMWNRIVAETKKFFPASTPTPWLVTAATDSTKYYAVSDNVYRFTPYQITDDERKSIHGVNESLECDNYLRMIDWYESFLKEFDEREHNA